MNDAAPRVSSIEIAMAFNHVALASFGGGLSAWSREIIVERKKWLDDKEFLSALTMCRILPGANQVNIAVFVGTKLRGASGAVAAILGLMAVPVMLTLFAGWAYFTFKEVPGIHGALHGASSAAVALTVAMVIKTGRDCLTGVIPVALFGAAFVLNGILRWPLVVTLLILVPLCLLWAWPRGTRTDSGQPAQ
ncbi:chromate transporter [Mycobacterium sp. 236(2023)]|uniref:chromate transporter n=1 Tax=Mycobacterium sp. 236(2023) TaxID=3038163 RepID=UPI00241541DB|nr:chromate transporter [Mycobacterium sp. 236(2023)]MDG4665685.1 chromate transporter [Mycobacterium sp. 236(2023)]